MSVDVFVFGFGFRVGGSDFEPNSYSTKAARARFAAGKTRDDKPKSFLEGLYFGANSWRTSVPER